MVRIPAGTFLMGSSDGSNPENADGTGLNTTTEEPGRYGHHEAQHKVTLTKDFYMTKYPITNTQYCEFLNDKEVQGEELHNYWYGGPDGMMMMGAKCTWGNNADKHLVYEGDVYYAFGVRWDEGQWVPQEGYDNHPVLWVTWFGALEYAEWAGGNLPTEAQWEYACRGGQTESLPFGIGNGTKLYSDMANIFGMAPYELPDGSLLGYEGGNGSHPATSVMETTAVGSYDYPNGYGLYDMHGNVEEWCLDSWNYENYDTTPATDPVSPKPGLFGILRGGHYDEYGMNCRSAYRHSFYMDTSLQYFGFRVVFNP